MSSVDLRKVFSFFPLEPAPEPGQLPAASNLYYECLDCTRVVYSIPHIKCVCECGNLIGGGGKTKVGKPDRVRVVKGELR